MNKDTLNRLLNELKPVADKLGQGAEYVWEVAYRQVYVSAAGMILAAIVVAALAKLFWHMRAQQYENMKTADSYSRSSHQMVAGMNTILSIVSAAGSATLLVSALMRFANPGFYAIKSLMRALGV